MSLRAPVADVRHLSRIVLVAAIHFLLAEAALAPSFSAATWEGSSAWQLASPACLLLWRRALAGLALGAFLATHTISGDVLYSLMTAAGNFSRWFAALAPARRPLRSPNRRARDVVALWLRRRVGLAAALSFGTLGLYLSDMVPSGAPRIGWKWTLGHAMGMVAVAPSSYGHSWWKERKQPWWLPGSALFILLSLVGAVAFWEAPASFVDTIRVPAVSASRGPPSASEFRRGFGESPHLRDGGLRERPRMGACPRAPRARILLT
jgi:hypothetical protein